MNTPTPALTASMATDADRVYGLEPVLDTGHDPRLVPLNMFAEVACPYCGGSYQSAVDLTQGDQDCIEDCQLCCQPIELSIVVREGRLHSIQARRGDEA